MKLNTLIPVFALTSSLAVAAPFHPPAPAKDDGASFNAIINPRNGHPPASGFRGDGWARHQGLRVGGGGRIGPRDNEEYTDATNDEEYSDSGDNDDGIDTTINNVVVKRDPEAHPDPFYPIHPNGKDNRAPAPRKPSWLSQFAKGYGFGPGPVVHTTPQPKKNTRRDAMPEPAPAPAPEARAEPGTAPFTPPPGTHAVYGLKNNNGKKGKTPSAKDLCDAKHMVCSDLQAKFYHLYSVFHNQ